LAKAVSSKFLIFGRLMRQGKFPVSHDVTECPPFAQTGRRSWPDASALAHLEDLVLHDAGRDIRAPTHELIRGHAVLRARQRILAEAPNWALSPAGLAALIGRAASRLGEGQGSVESDDEGAAAPDVDGPGMEEAVGDDPLRQEYAELDAIEARSTPTGQERALPT
jgi:hypothetical protein